MKEKLKNIKIYSKHIEQEALNQFYNAMNLEQNIQGALMPDAHIGYTLPIGAVIKSKKSIFPAYVGYDIGCGLGAIKTNITKEELLKRDLKKILNSILELVPIGKSSHTLKQNMPILPTPTKYANSLLHNALYQLGTLGSGNHFLEIGSGKDGFIWIVVHSGSRNLGKTIAENYMKLAALENVKSNKHIYAKEFEENNHWGHHNLKAFEIAKEKYIQNKLKRSASSIQAHYSLDINSSLGSAYFNDMNFALEFALANRRLMLERVLLVLKGKEEFFINKNHNHAELIDNDFIIHRKGATHAKKGMYGIIPGNMKDGSFVVIGKGNKQSLSSSSHGAGRVLSRRQALNSLDVNEFFNSMKGITSNHTNQTLDEAPKAYKNIFEVMQSQKDLVEVVDRIVPIINIKG